MTDLSISHILGDIDFELLTEEEISEYIGQLDRAVGDVWSLPPKQLYAEAIWGKVDWLLFGGAAGGGKSEMAIYHVNRLSVEIPGHSSLLLRRSIPELRRSLIVRLVARIVRYKLPAKYRKLDGQAGFAYQNMSLIECGHCQTDEDVAKYLSAEYDCVAPDTEIILACGTAKKVTDIKVGDMVMTLAGPKPVDWVGPVGPREAVQISTPYGTVTASLNHPFLTANGWLSPAAAMATAASRASGRSGSEWSGGGRPSTWQLPASFYPATLLGPDPQSPRTDASATSPVGAQRHEPAESSTQGSPEGCTTDRDSCGERSHPDAAGAQARTPSLAGVAASGASRLPMGDLASTRARTHGSSTWHHPYTKEALPASVAVHQAWVHIAQVGVREMWDMQVRGANHYCSSSAMIHRNCIIIDEATTLTENQIIQVSSRLRTTREKAALGARPHLGLFTNPGGISHAWMYDLFITPTNYGQKIVVYDISQGLEKKYPVRTYEAPIDVASATPDEIFDVLLPWAEGLQIEADPMTQLVVGFVPSKATDNPFLDPTYLKNLNTLPERRRKQLRDGDWDTFEGMFFNEFKRELHIIEPFEIPESWQRARGIDYGTTNPYACVWVAWDEDDNAYVYREDYEAGLTPQEQARRISALSVDWKGRREKYRATVADPAVFSNHRGLGKSVADMWRDAGLNVTRAKNQRVAGWANVRQYLWDYAAEKPRIFFFSTCQNTLRTLPLQQHSKTNQEDIDTDGDDHLMDCVRYVLNVRPISLAQRAEAEPQGASAKFNQMLRKADKRRRRSY